MNEGSKMESFEGWEARRSGEGNSGQQTCISNKHQCCIDTRNLSEDSEQNY